MTDEPGNKPDRTPTDRGLNVERRRTPESAAGGDGVAYDGTRIPASEMRDAKAGEETDAFKRLAGLRNDREALLAQLAGAQRQGVAHRPAIMTKGDIHPTEWARLMRLYSRLHARAQQREPFSVLAYSLYRLLSTLTKKGVVETESVLNGVMTPMGWNDDNITAFNTAVAIVWSMAADPNRPITPDMHESIRDLLTEFGLNEDDVMGQ